MDPPPYHVRIEPGREFERQAAVARFWVTKEQPDAIKRGHATIPDYVWHHHQDLGRMQLVPIEYHDPTKHVGGYVMWQRRSKK